MASVFFSYSHKDEALRDELEKHLAMLLREGTITTWHDRRIKAGDALDNAISNELQQADVVLLLVSVDFLSSEYCYGVEMKRAIERHNAGKCRVIPVILRPCEWHRAPFAGLLAVPTDGRPITKWPDRDDAFLNITTAIRAAISEMPGSPAGTNATGPIPLATASTKGPRSSNLRMRKTFTERDRDAFLDETFEYIARYFENSLAELVARNPGIEGAFKRLDATRFTATIYRSGTALARCTIRLGGMFGGGISLSYGTHHSDNSINESLSVEVGDQALTLKSLGMAMRRGQDRDAKLTQEGAAEYYWAIFIEPLQR